MVKDLRQQLRRATLRVINHQLEATLAHRLVVNHTIETLQVLPHYIAIAEHVDCADLVYIDTAKILAKEEILNFALYRLIDIETVLIKYLDIDHALIVGRYPHMDTTDSVGLAYIVTLHRKRNLVDIMHINAR